jgi:hypothetical protein
MNGGHSLGAIEPDICVFDAVKGRSWGQLDGKSRSDVDPKICTVCGQ